MAILATAQHTITDIHDPVISPTAPSNPTTDMLWMDTSDPENNILKRWDGTQWVETTLSKDDIEDLYEVISEYRSQIQQLDKQISLRVTEDQLKAGLLNKADTDWVTQRLETIIAQTSQDITFQFNQAKEFVVDSTSEFQTFVEEVRSYQRFSADGLELGKLNNPFLARLGNEKLSFLQNGVEIAYISNNKLYITEAQISEKMSVGTEDLGFFDWVMTDAGLGMKWRN